MKINQEKLKEQHKIIAKFRENRGKGTVIAATGFGKTYVGILLIKSMNNKAPENDVLVIVPTLYLKEQWDAKVKEFDLKNVTIVVVNTVIKMQYKTSLLILDEIHRYAADTFYKLFETVSYKFILGLTATLKRGDEKHRLLIEKSPVIYNISLKQSLDRGYVSKFQIYNLGITMPAYDREQYNKINERYNKLFVFFDHDLDLAFGCLKHAHLRQEVAQTWSLHENEIRVKAINFSRTLQKRKQFLYNSRLKLKPVLDIIERFPVKGITFSETTDFADLLTMELGSDLSFSYHNKVKGGKKVKVANFDKFNDKNNSVRIINTAKAMDEGADIGGIELGIVASGTSSKRQHVQRTGRIVRYEEGKLAIIVNIYIKDTQEQVWVTARTKGSPNLYWIESVDEIQYIPAIETTGNFALI